MGATYTRQSSYSDGDTITAAHTNDEFNQLLAAFASSTGHTHDGTSAEGGPITKLLGTTTYGSSSASFGTYGGASQPLVRQSVEGSGFAVALRVNDGGSTAPYSLKGFQLEYQVGARR